MNVKHKTYSLLRIFSIVGIILLLILQLIWLYNTSKIAQDNFIQQAGACFKKAIDEELDIRGEKFHVKKVFEEESHPIKIKEVYSSNQLKNASEANYMLNDYLVSLNTSVKLNILDSLFENKLKLELGILPKHNIILLNDSSYIIGKSKYINYNHTIKKNTIYINSRIGSKQILQLQIPSTFYIYLTLNTSILIISFILILLISIVLILQYKNFKREKKFSQFIIDYTRMIAHDLQSPVSSFRMMLQHFIANPKMETEMLNEFCTMGMDHSDRILFCLNNLLFLASSEQNDFRIHKTPTEIRLILEPLSQRIKRMESKDKRINLSIHYKPDRVFIPIDKTLMENVLFNLMENAVKFSNEIVSITLVVVENKHDYQITIQDNGIGMPEEVQERIFDLYDRGNERSGSLFSGYGIGLSFAQKVVKAHGGKISVNSKLDWGSIFTITLPKNY